MGIRFRKYFNLGKLLRLNVSKSGVSVTIGVKGASVNIGKNGAYLNTGIPGTGIYSRDKIAGINKGNNKYHSQESIKRTQQSIDEYNAYKNQVEDENRKSDIVPYISNEDLDELFLDVAHYIISNNCASPGRIKSKFNIDYVRTENLMQQLEENGIISAPSGSHGRIVLISEKAFNELKNKLNTKNHD